VIKLEEAEKGHTGWNTAQEILRLLTDWKCSREIAAMVFDTTSSNTGNG
jgi:hypothetical protein